MAALLAGLAPAPATTSVTAPSACAMAEPDKAWIAQALANWRIVAREKLRLPDRPLPAIVTFDAACAYVAPSRADGAIAWAASPHQGQVTLPDGQQIPASVISFAAPATPASQGYFVMSLPSVWKAAGVKSGLGVERLMDGVLLHELMHSYQFYFVSPVLDKLTRQYRLSDDINDDSLQEAFKGNSAYVAAWEAERDLLFAAAAAPDEAAARRLAGQALASLRARRARFFTGAAAQWAPLDEIFLTMEGLGQWAIFAWHRDPRGGGFDRDTALREVRRGGRWWSQDQGLALFLVVDRLVPKWQELAFAPKPETAEALLARAAGAEIS